MNWALIKDNKVKNVIKADADFTSAISDSWDAIVPIDSLTPKPGKNWSYENGEFTPPQVPELLPDQVARLEVRERLMATKDNIPIQGVALQNLLKDVIEVLF